MSNRVSGLLCSGASGLFLAYSAEVGVWDGLLSARSVETGSWSPLVARLEAVVWNVYGFYFSPVHMRPSLE